MENEYLSFLQKVDKEEGTREEFLPIWENSNKN